MIGLFDRIQSLLQGSFAKETYNFKEPTNRSHLIQIYRSHYYVFFPFLCLLSYWKFCASWTCKLFYRALFAEYRLFYRALLQKRRIIFRSLIIVATPYRSHCYVCFPFLCLLSYSKFCISWTHFRDDLHTPFSFLCLILLRILTLCFCVSSHFVPRDGDTFLCLLTLGSWQFVPPHTFLCLLTLCASWRRHFLVSPHTLFLTVCVSPHFSVSLHTFLCLLTLSCVSSHSHFCVSWHFVSPHTFLCLPTLWSCASSPFVSSHTFLCLLTLSFLCHTISHFCDSCVTARQKEREQETTSVCLYLCMCECVCVYVSVSMYVWLCLCMCECVCACVSMSVYVWVCLCRAV